MNVLRTNDAGELGQLQQDAVKAGRLPLRETINARMNAAADDRGRLEANLAGSLALRNAADHKRWLTIYIRHLSGRSPCSPSVRYLRHCLQQIFLARFSICACSLVSNSLLLLMKIDGICWVQAKATLNA